MLIPAPAAEVARLTRLRVTGFDNDGAGQVRAAVESALASVVVDGRPYFTLIGANAPSTGLGKPMQWIDSSKTKGQPIRYGAEGLRDLDQFLDRAGTGVRVQGVGVAELERPNDLGCWRKGLSDEWLRRDRFIGVAPRWSFRNEIDLFFVGVLLGDCIVSVMTIAVAATYRNNSQKKPKDPT